MVNILLVMSLVNIPSGYVKIAIEHGHRNSGFTHWKWWIFPLFFVCLPEGTVNNGYYMVNVWLIYG